MFTTAPASIARTIVAASATAVFAGLCLFGATAPAAAMTAGDNSSVVVSYSDLNLASDAGRKALDARIVQAAKALCYNGGRDAAMSQAYAKCLTGAVNGARNKVMPAIASIG